MGEWIVVRCYFKGGRVGCIWQRWLITTLSLPEAFLHDPHMIVPPLCSFWHHWLANLLHCPVLTVTDLSHWILYGEKEPYPPCLACTFFSNALTFLWLAGDSFSPLAQRTLHSWVLCYCVADISECSALRGKIQNKIILPVIRSRLHIFTWLVELPVERASPARREEFGSHCVSNHEMDACVDESVKWTKTGKRVSSSGSIN